VTLTKVNLLDAVFGGTDTVGTNTWSDTICPDGTNSNNDGATCDHDGVS
jgi:hypothetical protein